MAQGNLTQVEEMLRDAKKADEPGTLVKGAITPESTTQLSLGVMELKSAGYVWIFDTKTGEPSKVNRNMLPSKLKQTRPDGSFVFSLKQTVKPVRGAFKCMLHPDDSNRAYYDSLGLAVCLKSNLTSPFQVERHMQKRHRVEWETIKSERDRKEKQEDRELQRQMLRSMGETKLPKDSVPVPIPTPTVATPFFEPLVTVQSESVEDVPLYVSPNPKLPKKRGRRRRKEK